MSFIVRINQCFGNPQIQTTLSYAVALQSVLLILGKNIWLGIKDFKKHANSLSDILKC